MTKSLTVALLLVTTTTTARADSLEETKYWKGQMLYIDRDLASAEKQCGTKLAFEIIEKDKVKLREAHDKQNHTPSAVCGAVIQSIALICRRGDAEKAAVKAKIQHIRCGAGAPRSLALDKGTVQYLGNLEETNLHEWVRGWFEKKL